LGGSDGEILVSLNQSGHTNEYLKKVREAIHKQYPDLTIFTQPADIVSQILNFGLTAPIDIQVAGRKDDANLKVATWIQGEVNKIPGAVDVHLQQIVDAPQLRVNVDRTLARQAGLTQQDVANSMLISLSSSGQAAPNYWLNYANGVNYQVAAQTPYYQLSTMQDLLNTPIASSSSGASTLGANTNSLAGPATAAAGAGSTELLRNLASISREQSKLDISHYNIQPVYDVLCNVQDRDLGGVANAIDKVVDQAKKKLPKGAFIAVRGQVDTMRSSFSALELGIVLSIVLVYFLLVVNFQSWIDPLVILSVLPGTFAGILWALFGTSTTFSVPALMGTMMCIGVATANSILVISFANEARDDGASANEAALKAGKTRFRPVIMTALAMIIGMLPMALGFGEGGEQNAPLGRAVIGGLSFATVCTLIFAPIVYSILRAKDRPVIDRLSDAE
jgi:multidrug efflux pump subunit AcrB